MRSNSVNEGDVACISPVSPGSCPYSILAIDVKQRWNAMTTSRGLRRESRLVDVGGSSLLWGQSSSLKRFEREREGLGLSILPSRVRIRVLGARSPNAFDALTSLYIWIVDPRGHPGSVQS